MNWTDACWPMRKDNFASSKNFGILDALMLPRLMRPQAEALKISFERVLSDWIECFAAMAPSRRDDAALNLASPLKFARRSTCFFHARIRASQLPSKPAHFALRNSQFTIHLS